MGDAVSMTMGVLVGSRYRIEGRLGEGGMGVVYRAHDERLGRAVALKVVAKKGGPSAVRRLQREARAVASLDHRGIAMLFDVVDAPDLGVVLVMELVRGESLRAYIAAGTRAPREAARIVLDVAESLGAAHRAGLVHRDVKPDNIIVRPDGRTALLDFGIAKAMTERSEASADQLPAVDTGDTTEGLVVGTPAYLAPEQALASADITGDADQFALAVVAYEMLTGQSPWKSATTGATLIAQIVGGAPPPPSALRPELGPRVDQAIGEAMRKKPGERFATIEAFGQALVAAVEATQPLGAAATVRASIPDVPPRDLPFAQTEVGAREAATKSTRPARRRSRVALVVTALLGVAGVGVLSARALTRPRADSSPGAATSASSPAPSTRGTTYADIPMSATESPQAAKALRDALLDLRDADDDAALAALGDAIRLDPTSVSARLQRAILLRLRGRSTYGTSDQAGHDDYMGAARDREGALPRDRALIDAWEPVFNQVPADLRATEARLTVLAGASSDAQTWSQLGSVRQHLGLLPAAGDAFAREAEIDGQSASALFHLALVRELLDDLAGARTGYERCFRAQPRAAACRYRLVMLLESAGPCEAFVQRAREFATLAPSDPDAIEMKLRADVASNVPRVVVNDAVRSLPGFEGLNDQAWVHEVYGELGAAGSSMEQIATLMTADHDSANVAYAMEARMLELGEAGELPTVVRLASDYDARLAALPPLEEVDHLPYVLSILLHAGKISPEELQRRRAAWISRWLPPAARNRRFSIWVRAYAEGAIDESEATAALAALPSFGEALPTPAATDYGPNKAAVARVLVLAGHPQARAYLDAATSDCTPDFYSIRSQYWSGRAYEAAGDVPRACSAYARVLERWGNAKPRSVTADASRARMRDLACRAAGK